MVTIAFSQGVLFHRLPLELGYRRRRWPYRVEPPGAGPGLCQHRHRWQRHDLLLSGAGPVRRGGRHHGGAFCARLSAGRCSPYARTNAAHDSSGIPVEQHIWLSFVISCLFVALAGTLYALLNTSPIRVRCAGTSPGDFVIMAVLGGMRSFWAAHWRSDFRCAAGLCLQPYRGGCRSSGFLRPHCPVLPARCPRHHP